MQLDEPLRERQAETGSLALLDPGFGLLELLEDTLRSSAAMPGPVSATETLTSPLTCVALTSTGRPRA